MKKNDPLAHLRWLAHHPSLLVSGTAQGAIKAFEDQEREMEVLMRAVAFLSDGTPPLNPPPGFADAVGAAREWCEANALPEV